MIKYFQCVNCKSDLVFGDTCDDDGYSRWNAELQEWVPPIDDITIFACDACSKTMETVVPVFDIDS